MLSKKDIYNVVGGVENFCENLVDENCVDSVEDSNRKIEKLNFSSGKLVGNGLYIVEYILGYSEIRKDFNVEDIEEIGKIVNKEIEKYKYDYIVKSREELVGIYGVSKDFIFIDLNEDISYNLDKICDNEDLEDYVFYSDGKYMLVNFDRFIGLYDMKKYDNEYDYDLFMFVEYLCDYVKGSEMVD